ncbi:MAG: TetR/AcrR family transcriptional regulator [Chloroflexia bacterium]
MDQQETLTPKGKRTRERILDTAVRLFAAGGYDRTTMRDIAAGAGCALGLTYRYFPSKEAIVLALYARLADKLNAQVRELPPAPLAERFDRAIEVNLALLAPYRESMTALFGPALNLESGIAVLGTATGDVRRQVRAVFAHVVAEATDAPPEPLAGQLATLLYGLHLAAIFFWLQDRTSGLQATGELRALIRDMLALARPLLELPPAGDALARLLRVVGPILGPADSTLPHERNSQ